MDILRAGKLLINTSKTGTGKTYITTATMLELKQRFLVISPKATKTSWQRVTEAMGASRLCHDVTNAERLNFNNPYYVDGAWKLPRDLAVVIDEPHRGMSGINSKLTAALAKLKFTENRVVLMSATIADSPLKMRGLGFLAGLHNWNLSSFNSWCRSHGCFVINVNGRHVLQFSKGPAGRAHMAELHQQLKDIMVHLDTADCPGFPETFVTAKLFDLESDNLEEVNRIYDELDEELVKEHANPMTAMLRARQRTELLKVPLLRDLATEAIEEGQAPVVFVNFRDTLQSLQAALVTAGHKVSVVHGDQPDRQQNLDRFEANQTAAMVAMIQAGGVGVNMHDVRHERQRVSFITPTFSASELRQALGRIHRAGGTATVQTIVLVAGSIEERIYAAVSNKLSNLDTLTDGDLT